MVFSPVENAGQFTSAAENNNVLRVTLDASFFPLNVSQWCHGYTHQRKLDGPIALSQGALPRLGQRDGRVQRALGCPQRSRSR
jgi:hypothetical protein